MPLITFCMRGMNLLLLKTCVSVIVKRTAESRSLQDMRVTIQPLSYAILLSALAMSAAAQAPLTATGNVEDPLRTSAKQIPSESQVYFPAAPATQTVQRLLNSADSDVKFDLRDLMDILRDRRHEGWVLAAYPDPKTRRPLIGAGFSLDLPAREHQQHDPLNPHPFLEPSSSELWQAAGLDPERLQDILDQFRYRFPAQPFRRYRNRITALPPQVTDREATLLLRVSALQAVYNAKGYCRNFDQLTASQQMALSQLVYQMGVNLDEFSEFLKLINTDLNNSDPNAASSLLDATAAISAYWKAVQQSLIQSQWARLYRIRAVSVIAMLDPLYAGDPGAAEQRVGATLRPTVVHRRRDRSTAGYQLAANRGSRGRKLHQTPPHARSKRRV